MSENKPGTGLTAEELQAVGGGECSVADYLSALANLKQSYETLIDFASYMIERIDGGTPAP
ncbi:MAG TPA: hypothetical protein VEC19_10000 [Usitatibacter sp.]|nr:hypothetical protein [Usitatibacter sp.]